MKLIQLALNKIRPFARQPREHFNREKIQELADSIKTHGLIQPVVVREKGKQYEIIAGERRTRALTLAKEKTVPAIVRENMDEVKAMELSLIENWHREDLTSVERENMVYALWETGRYETYKDLAKTLGVDDTGIAYIIKAKDFRDNKKLSSSVTTRTISDTAGLPDKERKEIIKKVEKGDLAPKRVREEVRLRKLEKELPTREEIPEIRKTPADFVDELQTKLMETWAWVGVKLPVEKQDEILEWVSKHFTAEQKKELLQTMQITALALERFMEALK